MSVKPEMAYPVFASATYTFSPVKWPVAGGGGEGARIFFADGQTAGGAHVRFVSPLTRDVVTLDYRLLSTTDKDALVSFFKNVMGAQFEYRDVNNVVRSVKFLTDILDVTPRGARWDVSSLEMVVVQ